MIRLVALGLLSLSLAACGDDSSEDNDSSSSLSGCSSTLTDWSCYNGNCSCDAGPNAGSWCSGPESCDDYCRYCTSGGGSADDRDSEDGGWSCYCDTSWGCDYACSCDIDC